MKIKFWLAAVFAAVLISGCSDNDGGSAGPAGGLYISYGGPVDDEIEPIPGFDEMAGYGIVAGNGQAAFIYQSEGLDIASVGPQFIPGPLTSVYWGNVSAQQPELPEGPEEEVLVETGFSGSFDIYSEVFLFLLGFLEEELDGFITAAGSINTDPIQNPDDYCFSPSRAEDGLPKSIFMADLDVLDPETLEPGDSPVEFFSKSFCAEVDQMFTFDGETEEGPFGFEGFSDKALIDEYEMPSNLSALSGEWIVSFLGLGLFGGGDVITVLDIDEDGSFELEELVDESVECIISGNFEIIDADYNVYRLRGESGCGAEIEGTASLDMLFTLSESFAETVALGSPGPVTLDAQTVSEDGGVAIGKLAISAEGQTFTLGLGFVMEKAEF